MRIQTVFSAKKRACIRLKNAFTSFEFTFYIKLPTLLHNINDYFFCYLTGLGRIEQSIQ